MAQKFLVCDDVSSSHNWKWEYNGETFTKTAIPSDQLSWRSISEHVVSELRTHYGLCQANSTDLWNNFRRRSHWEAAYQEGFKDGQNDSRSRYDSRDHDMGM